MTAAEHGPSDAADPTSAAQLRLETRRFLQRFGLASGLWTIVLAVTAPTVVAGWALAIGVGLATAWALASQFLRPSRGWWLGWLVTTILLEWTAPLAGTDGWSVTGGAMLIAVFSVVLTNDRRLIGATTLLLVAVQAARPLLGPWPISRVVTTSIFLVFSVVGLTWLVGAIEREVDQRDRLQAQLLAARTAAARATERAEAGARLHDTVLQHLTAVTQSADLDAAHRNAGRASNELRQFLRAGTTDESSLRQVIQQAATDAADGTPLSVSVVGDGEVTPTSRLVVEAMAEAVRNAARHGDPPIRVHAELPVGRDDLVVWVADQGSGFDPATVPPDRLGVRESIVGRMRRAGGSATLEVQDTTEWELRLPAT